jgi:hypothetical protein
MKTWKGNSRLRFRAIELPARSKSAALGVTGLVCLWAAVVVGCEKTTGGTAISTSGTASSRSSAAPTLSDPAEPVPGVETTLREHIPPNAVVCLPSPTGGGRMTMASVSDPVAPKVTVQLPEGWNSTPGTGDVALTSAGPDGMSVRVTIEPTDLEPGGAFLRYTADLRTRKPDVKVTVAAAQFCGYSSQLLSGTGPGAVDFADRITHTWTNTKAYLVVVHLEGPAGAPGFDAAKSTVMQQFAVVIP